LVLFEGERVQKVYPVAVGKPSTPTPSGDFRIINLIPNPTWYGPDKVVPPGPANPVGTRWIGLSVKGYGIHGTNEPRSIGKAVSHGCVRMRRTDLEELFDMVAAGDSVTLADGRTPEVSRLVFTQVFQISFVN
jgi:lipoprotein-anchoring transpeptidase ErfK/SrfK